MDVLRIPRWRLNTGGEIPALGLGVYQIPPGRATREAVQIAIEVGYRHIDTARIYGNEEDVGAAIRGSGVPRDEIFVTTKLWNSDHGRDATLRAFDESLRRLRLDAVDLYLVHWPVPRVRGETWKAMEAIHRSGRARAIGVSNYMEPHLQELLADASVVPAVNQVEFSPFRHRKGLLELCRGSGIQAEAYSPLTKGLRLGHPRLRSIGERMGRSPAQVLLRWSLQHGLVVIPKTVRRERMLENGRVFDFELSPADMALLDGLDEGLATGWDPEDAP